MGKNIYAWKLDKWNLNKHHICPTSRWGVNIQDNIVRLNIDIHQALHRLFGNMTIEEQMKRLVKISETALRADFKEELIELLSWDKDFYYKNGIYLSKK